MITLSRHQIDRVKEAAARCYPDECCGLIVGWRDAQGNVTVTEIVESDNISTETRHDHFEVEPQVRFNTMRKTETMAHNGHSIHIIGHYHSHPDHPAVPSAQDLDMAYEPDLIWMIASVINAKVDSITTHELVKSGETHKFQRIDLKIV